MSSLFHLPITHNCKLKYQPNFMSEPHSFLNCNHNLTIDTRIWGGGINKNILQESVGYMEFTIKSTV